MRLKVLEKKSHHTKQIQLHEVNQLVRHKAYNRELMFLGFIGWFG
jgi:hypothetical protein